MEQLVELYIRMRDAKAKLKAKYDEQKAGLDLQMDKVEAELLRQFQLSGLNSVSTDAGTAYKSVRTSATVADWDATLEFIRENDLWNMLERRVSKDAVVQWREENGDLPPGLNWREEVTVNVRR